MNLEDFLYHNSFRTGQRELADAVYRACKEGRYLVAEAMSGFGKTAAVLSGSLLAAHEDGLAVFYACRTKRQVSRVMEEISFIQSKKQVPAVDISSKYDYCLRLKQSPTTVTADSFKWYCSFHVTNNLCSYFLNVTLENDRAMRLAEEKANRSIPHTLLMQKSEQSHVCPYEVARLALPRARLIATTYHYVLDEGRSLLLSSPQFEPSRTVLVCDEAHNLRDFIRDLSTTSLTQRDLEDAKEEARQLFMQSVHEAISSIEARINSFHSSSGGWRIDKRAFLRALSGGHDERWLAETSFELSMCTGVAWLSFSSRGTLPRAVLRVGRFLADFLACLDEENIWLIRSEASLSILSVDPTERFIGTTKKFRSTILLSATLGPSQLYLDSMGLPPSTIVHRADEVSTLRITTLIDLSVTTKFKNRSDEMYARIASKIASTSAVGLGGVGVFAASYAVLNSLVPFIESKLGKENLLVESKTLNNLEAGRMMELFRTNERSMLLAVQGGRFSEGEDFRGDTMNTTVVVGLSMPPPSAALFAEYAHRTKSAKEDSFLTLSLLPALRKAFQSAGRHIRKPSKTGIVLLLDSRFNEKRVKDLMPSWLKQNLKAGNLSEEEIQRIMKDCLGNKADSSINQNGAPFR